MELSPTVIDKIVNAAIASGPGGILAIVLFYYWRTDRSIIVELTKDFKSIVQENTKAITANTEVTRQLKDNICRYTK